jgi:hypothetical protein
MGIDKQLGQRNITEQVKNFLLGLRYRGEKKKVTNEKGLNQFSEVEGQNVPQPTTAEIIAQQNNVSEKTVKRAEKFADGIDNIMIIN